MSKEIQKQITQIFQIDQLLGSGAYGHVWKVQQKSTKKTYALKKVFDAFQNDIDAQRTYREITILHELDNPGVIKLKGVIKAQNDKDLYLVFQHMQTDLHSLVGEDILQLPHLCFIIYQIFKALKYIHSAQLVHRDLKPSNVLINSDCQVKLCDFGLVRSLTRQENTQLILSEDVATRWYRSPQMLLGSQQYGWQTDVWSVGCILAQLIIGEPILMGGSNIQQLQKILQLTGIPKKQDIASIKSHISQSLINQFKILKKPFKHYFKNSKYQNNTQIILLIKSMLEFNPQKRITVQQVLGHELFEQIRDKREQLVCRKMIIPQVDDNVRLSVQEYREFIYKDILRRYPQYNIVKKTVTIVEDDDGQQNGNKRIGSIFRYNRGHHSLVSKNNNNRNSSINSLPRAKATNSLMRQQQLIRNKYQHKTTIQTNNNNNNQINNNNNNNQVNNNNNKSTQQIHQSLHCNTAHNSNFYKTAHSNSIQHKQQYSGSLHARKNPFVSSIDNSNNNKYLHENKQSNTNVNTVILEKSPVRRNYQKLNGNNNNNSISNKLLNNTNDNKIKMDIIQGLLCKDNNNKNTIGNNRNLSKQKLISPPKSFTNNNINSLSNKLLNTNNNNNNSSSKLYFYDPTSIYRSISPTAKDLLTKKQNQNNYKVAQISNQNKITKKTFTKFRKQNNLSNVGISSSVDVSKVGISIGNNDSTKVSSEVQ